MMVKPYAENQDEPTVVKVRLSTNECQEAKICKDPDVDGDVKFLTFSLDVKAARHLAARLIVAADRAEALEAPE